MATTTTVAPFGAITVHRILGSVEGLIIEFRNWRNAQRTASELRKLSMRQLDDIGLMAGDIDDFARQLARRS